jgi:histidinol-phosphate aminotransferase
MIEKLVRKNIKNVKPYQSARDEYDGESALFLDANEYPEGDYNRYPDPYQKEIKKILAELQDVKESQIFLGNGSDEVIDLLMRIFCNPGFDEVLGLYPSYGMYEVSAAINDLTYTAFKLDGNFQISQEVLEKIKNSAAKIIFLCSPNNPTGNLLNPESVVKILENFNGIVVLDEAYIDFAKSTSWKSRLAKFENLVVLQTFSKSWGLAGARVGIAYANEKIIHYLNKVKPPYNISTLNQNQIMKTLLNFSEFKQSVNHIIQEKKWLLNAFGAIDLIDEIYPSDANFFLVKFKANANRIYEYLLNEKIVVRNRDRLVEGTLRITVGTRSENEALIKALYGFNKA